MAARKRDESAAEVLQAAQEPTTNAELEALKEAQKRENQAMQDLAEKRKAREEAQAAAQEKHRKDLEAKRKAEMDQRVVPVVVQRQKDAPVQIRGVVIPCRTPVKVSRRELRHLEVLRRMGAIQLVVGELEKPGDVSVKGKG